MDDGFWLGKVVRMMMVVMLICASGLKLLECRSLPERVLCEPAHVLCGFGEVPVM